MHTCTYCTHLSFFLSQSHMQIISHVKLPYRNVDIKILWLISSLVCFNLSPSPSSCLCGSPLTSGGFFLFGGGCNNSDREELRSEKQTKCEGNGGGVRCSWGLLWSHVGSFSLRRLRHDSLSAQNGLRHISMSDLCVCLTLRTVVNSAGARRWSAAAAAAECWHTCRAEKKSTHTYTHAQSQSRLGQSGSKHLYSWKVLHWLHHLQCSIWLWDVAFYFHTQKTLDCVGVCLWLYGATWVNTPGWMHFSTWIILENTWGRVFWRSNWPPWHTNLCCTCLNLSPNTPLSPAQSDTSMYIHTCLALLSHTKLYKI